MVSRSSLRTFLGPSILLILIYSVWFVRYPIWQLFDSVEPLFLMLILSYSAVLIISIIFLKKDSEKPLSEVFRVRSYGVMFVAVVFAVVFQAVRFLVSLTIGGDLDFSSFPSFTGYERYAVNSILLAFALYSVFAVFGALVEEIAFRAYVQSRISSDHGQVASILYASLLFSLQHIHVFHPEWVIEFFQSQFIYVLCLSFFVGYLFLKSSEDLWSVFAFHATMNVFNICIPIEVNYKIPFSAQIVTVVSSAFMILLLRLTPIEETVYTNDDVD